VYVGSMVVCVGDLYRCVVLISSHPSFLVLDGVGSRTFSVRTDQEARSSAFPLHVITAFLLCYLRCLQLQLLCC